MEKSGPAFVDGLMPVAWLSISILMFVLRVAAVGDDKSAKVKDKPYHVDKYWLTPRPEAPERIDILRSVPAVIRYLEGSRGMCDSRQFSRATYDALLAMSEGTPGIRCVTATSRGGANAVPGRPSAPPSEPSRKLYRLKNMAVPGDDSDTLESTAPFAPPHRNSYRLKDLDVMSDTSSGEQETMAVFLAGGRPLSLQHDARDHGLRPRTRRLKYEGDRGGPGSRTARRRQPQGTRSACSSSDARPRGSAHKAMGTFMSESEEVKAGQAKGRRKRRYADIDDAAEALEYEECLPQAYSRSARKHGRGDAVAPTGGSTGAAEAGASGMEGAPPATAPPSGMAHENDGGEWGGEDGDDEDTAEAYDSEVESGAALGVDWTSVGAGAVEDGTSAGEHAVDTIFAPLTTADACMPLPPAALVGPAAVATTALAPESPSPFCSESLQAPSVASSASANFVPGDPSAAALAARMRGHLDTLHAHLQQTERLALQAESVGLQLGTAKQRQAAAAAAELQARQATVATQAASAIAVAAAEAAGDLERAGHAANERAARVAAAAALAAKAAAQEAAEAQREASVFLEKAIAARREAERASAADICAVAALATARREKDEAAARVASLEAELTELAARCPG